MDISLFTNYILVKHFNYTTVCNLTLAHKALSFSLRQYITVARSDLVVIMLTTDPRFVGSHPAEENGFLRVIKIHSVTSFGGVGGKTSGPML
jgi:hypothetical protein